MGNTRTSRAIGKGDKDEELRVVSHRRGTDERAHVVAANNMNGDVWHLVLMFVAPHEELHQLMLSMRLWCHACRQAVETLCYAQHNNNALRQQPRPRPPSATILSHILTADNAAATAAAEQTHLVRNIAFLYQREFMESVEAPGLGTIIHTVLNDARRLKSLDVKYNSQIVTVTPFPELTALEAQCSCGIGDAGLTGARRLAVLKCAQNPRITTVRPFAHTLTSLDAGGRGCGIGDAGLAGATALTALRAWDNVKITTVTPFAGSLTKLDASGTSGIADVALARAFRPQSYRARRWRPLLRDQRRKPDTRGRQARQAESSEGWLQSARDDAAAGIARIAYVSRRQWLDMRDHGSVPRGFHRPLVDANCGGQH